jgi:hypothetical protein
MIINLSGPEGNAFFLLAKAQQLAKSEGREPAEIRDLLLQMQSGNYENLLRVFSSQFPYVNLINS